MQKGEIRQAKTSHRNTLQKAKNNKYFFKHIKHRKPAGEAEVGCSARGAFIGDKVRTEQQEIVFICSQ